MTCRFELTGQLNPQQVRTLENGRTHNVSMHDRPTYLLKGRTTKRLSLQHSRSLVEDNRLTCTEGNFSFLAPLQRLQI